MEKWYVTNKKADFKGIGQKFGIDQVIARVIRNRDIIGEEAVDRYLNGTPAQLYSPHLMKDLDLAVSILEEKIRQKRKIRIIGDYDIDGVQATYILLKGLRRAGACASAAIPDRIRDGYGINEDLIQRAREDGADTILTCDNGIAALDAVAYAKELGLTVILTDHHDIPYTQENGEKSYLRSRADAVVNPKQEDCGYPFKGLCGAAVAWKLILALYESMGIEAQEGMEFMENAAFATVGDVMELLDENRIIVKYGIEQMRHTKNPGLFALMRQKNIEPEQLSAYHLGFVLGPCINAGGRLDTAKRSLELMMETDRIRALQLAVELSDLNEERKSMTKEGVEAARMYMEENKTQADQVIVVYLPGLHESLAGIVAGRVREAWAHPVFVLTKTEDGSVKGSGRSIEAYSMYDRLCEVKDLFTKFGGHPMAAGVSMPEKNVEEFRKRLNENAGLAPEDFIEKIHIDVPMPLEYIKKELVEQLSLLEPFGCKNPKPVFADKKLTAVRHRVVGKNKNVIKLTLRSPGGMEFSAVYFGDIPAMLSHLERSQELSILYYPQINTYMGKEEIEIIITSFC